MLGAAKTSIRAPKARSPKALNTSLMRDGCGGAAGEITQDLGKPLSRFGVLIRGWGGSETTRRVGHGRV